jgi:primosomal protein N' (replication factor Y)
MRKNANTKFARHLRKTLTDAETRLWFHLRRRQLAGFRFRRQHPIGSYVADFVCIEARLVIELDGSQHLDSIPDARRDNRIRAEGFHILRVWNDDAVMRTDEVLELILASLVATHRHPHVPPHLHGT